MVDPNFQFSHEASGSKKLKIKTKNLSDSTTIKEFCHFSSIGKNGVFRTTSLIVCCKNLFCLSCEFSTSSKPCITWSDHHVNKPSWFWMDHMNLLNTSNAYLNISIYYLNTSHQLLDQSIMHAFLIITILLDHLHIIIWNTSCNYLKYFT